MQSLAVFVCVCPSSRSPDWLLPVMPVVCGVSSRRKKKFLNFISHIPVHDVHISYPFIAICPDSTRLCLPPGSQTGDDHAVCLSGNRGVSSVCCVYLLSN